jgi:hypothetical protein
MFVELLDKHVSYLLDQSFLGSSFLHCKHFCIPIAIIPASAISRVFLHAGKVLKLSPNQTL